MQIAAVSKSTIQSFVNDFAQLGKKVDLRDFIAHFCSTFYPGHDISFMDYFIELSKKENEGEFIVPHSKLYEYGAASGDRSVNIRAHGVRGHQRKAPRGLKNLKTSNDLA